MSIVTRVVVLSVVLGASALAADPPPDLVLLNGHVSTAAADRPTAEAIAIRAGRIVAVDTSQTVMAPAGPSTRGLDGQGRVVVPGFNDAHDHHVPRPAGTTLALKFPEPTWDEVLAALGEAVPRAPAGTWIYGTVGGRVILDPRPRAARSIASRRTTPG